MKTEIKKCEHGLRFDWCGECRNARRSKPTPKWTKVRTLTAGHRTEKCPGCSKPIQIGERVELWTDGEDNRRVVHADTCGPKDINGRP